MARWLLEYDATSDTARTVAGLAGIEVPRQECHGAGLARSPPVGCCEACDATLAEEVHEQVEPIKEALRDGVLGPG